MSRRPNVFIHLAAALIDFKDPCRSNSCNYDFMWRWLGSPSQVLAKIRK